MKMIYETNRLLVQLCDEANTAEVTRFLLENKDFFAPWEQQRPASFYTEEFQSQVLHAEFQAAMKGTYFRYYFSKKESPETIIGTVSFSGISRMNDKSCTLGYKLAQEETGRGFAFEALSVLLDAIHESYSIHRVEADIMEENESSRKLVEKLGFECEGIARSSHLIQGVWQNHLRYAFIFS